MKQVRKTKIVCTLGPAAQTPEIIRKLIVTGMNCARLNFSHGDHAEHLGRANIVKELRDELNLPVALMLDTKGPEIRTMTLEEGKVELQTGESFILYSDGRAGSAAGVSVTYPLFRELSAGNRVLIDDGLIALEVEDVCGTELHCRILNGGTLGSKKSVNLPGVRIELPALTEQDELDIAFAAKQDFDFIAASFVRKASDVKAIRRVLRENGGENIRIIAKIENQEGVDRAEEIIAAADGIMVARGDLGVEIPAEAVPMVQKKLIKKCVEMGKPVITATQMLDSMTRNPRPTRAEVNDVANAVFDGTSGVMLSGETANGLYPVEAVSTMVSIVRRAETAEEYIYAPYAEQQEPKKEQVGISDAITHAACTTAQLLNADAIITVTTTGTTARLISRFRPRCPIVAVTPLEKTKHQLAISWGISPCVGEIKESADVLFDIGVKRAKEIGMVEDGDMAVITAGMPTGVSGMTSIIKAQEV